MSLKMMELENWLVVFEGMAILIIIGVACIVYWHKKINSETTLRYGIYVVIHFITGIIVLIGLELNKLIH